MSTNQKLRFMFGLRAAYDSLLQKDEILDNALYFLLDTNELYRGRIPLCRTHYYEGNMLVSDLSESAAITRIIGNATPVINDLCVLNLEDGIKHLYIYTGYVQNSNIIYDWRPLYGNIEGENIIFNDGESLIDKLQSVTSSQLEDIDENAFIVYKDENDNVTGFSLIDLGLKYYVDNGQGYEAVIVDANHPWPEGLSLQTINFNDEIILGWTATPSFDVTSIRRDVQNLKTLVGETGTPSTGLVGRIEAIETNHVRQIKIGNLTLMPTNNSITLPIFNGQNNGLVPQPGDNANTYILSSDGTWIDPSDMLKLEWQEIKQ